MAVQVGYPANWRELPAAEKKRHGEETLQMILDDIAGQNREPDNWERFCTASAINSTAAGWYLLAMNHLEYSQLPPDQRGIEPRIGQEDLDQMNMETLRRGLEWCRRLPPNNFYQG